MSKYTLFATCGILAACAVPIAPKSGDIWGAFVEVQKSNFAVFTEGSLATAVFLDGPESNRATSFTTRAISAIERTTGCPVTETHVSLDWKTVQAVIDCTT